MLLASISGEPGVAASRYYSPASAGARPVNFRMQRTAHDRLASQPTMLAVPAVVGPTAHGAPAPRIIRRSRSSRVPISFSKPRSEGT